ncbi:3-isopropylmalate dehydratase small subunit 1 (plasmid) [Sphingobium sp. AntQ-1]|uniref:3-isopropylmalate dehydratase small subunit n=1 Tax=Sphingobium sp. AntQ-1 TaxID=2930091 RepID=UPI00234ECDEF|nr:3-isopropylmalate dehydratase small subunit [Sphingobium sp. AntQ-1]WCP16248.1 3-isopropylmalate dehydratase small subunit 1 [Sphingobium sp. AntQ-1]
MTPFVMLEAIAAAVPIANVDTDMLVPARFLKTVSREGLAEALFHNLRVDDPTFPLNRAPWTGAGIIVALDNFGCGSSREHAPWALLDFGIRCVIAPSFADIFRQNCFKNGILPIELAPDRIATLLARAANPATARMTVRLVDQRITSGDVIIPFEIDPERRRRLLNGLDDIGLSLRHLDSIVAHERRAERAQPWVRSIPVDIGSAG